MDIIYGWTPYFTDTGDAGRIIAGIWLHNTETSRRVEPHSQGSWAYLIDRDGTIIQFVHDLDIAWGVRDCDEHWPAWLPRWGDFALSRANEWGIQVELVSDASHRAAGEPYTAAQYAALRWLIGTHLYGTYGRLPVDTHGRVQKDRTDPVAFDFERAGLVFDQPRDAWLYGEEDEVTPEDKAIVDAVRGLGGDAASVRGWINQIGALEGYAATLEAEVAVLQEEVADRNADVTRLTEAVAAAGRAGRPIHVTVMMEDSAEHEFVLAT